MQLYGPAGSAMVDARRCEPKLAAPAAYRPLATPPNLLSTGPRQDSAVAEDGGSSVLAASLVGAERAPYTLVVGGKRVGVI